jgi:hypothetical protein
MSPGSKFEILVPDDPDLSAAPCDPEKHPTFKRLFERPQLADFAAEAKTYSDVCLLFTNASSLRITALTLAWSFPHPTLKGPSGHVSRSDSYYFGDNTAGVIPPKSQALIHPKRTIPAKVLEYENLLFASSDGRLNGLRDVDMIQAAPLITARFDTVIFEDGRVLGDDESGTVGFITSRKKAANDFVALVQRAHHDGLNLDVVLTKLRPSGTGGPRDDPYGFWLATFARQLMHVPAASRLDRLMPYADLPEPPQFFR